MPPLTSFFPPTRAERVVWEWEVLEMALAFSSMLQIRYANLQHTCTNSFANKVDECCCHCLW